MISFICWLEIFSAVIPELNVLFWIPVTVADAAAVNANGIKNAVS